MAGSPDSLLKKAKNKTQFCCQECGYVAPRWMGKCPECSAWNSMIEERPTAAASPGIPSVGAGARPVQLSEVSFERQRRHIAKSQEFNRVLGGGIVPGSVVLIGGDPGIGKSTLMLQEGVGLAAADFPVLYVSGEESVQQTKLRAERLDIDSEHLYVLPETDVNAIGDAIARIEPALTIIDSIQTVSQPAFESSPGSISQVRECALVFSKIAKARHMPVFLVGHVTKEGYLAGPKVLEHMVDVQLHFEGDRQHVYRILRAVKNRFGSTREIGVFEMKKSGLQDVANPSTLFLGQHKDQVSGSCVICTMEGSRPFLVEIQALVTPTNYGLPQRTATGVDGKRLSLLLAVLEKRIGLRLGTYDVFVNAAGGAKIDDPSADLGILTAIASSFKDQVISAESIMIGEIGLGGELRAVSQIEQRVDEAAKLGFQRVFVPTHNKKNVGKKPSLDVIGCERAEDILQEALC